MHAGKTQWGKDRAVSPTKETQGLIGRIEKRIVIAGLRNQYIGLYIIIIACNQSF